MKRRSIALSKLLTLHDADILNNININTSSVTKIREYVSIINNIVETYSDYKYMSIEDFMIEPFIFSESECTTDDHLYILHLLELNNHETPEDINFIDKKTSDTIMSIIGEELRNNTPGEVIGLFGTKILLNKELIVFRYDLDEESAKRSYTIIRMKSLRSIMRHLKK